VLAFADVMNLFPYELAGLGGRRLAFTRVFVGALDCFSVRHRVLLCNCWCDGHLPSLLRPIVSNRIAEGGGLDHDRPGGSHPRSSAPFGSKHPFASPG
jgi:hypothetical protein